MTTGTEWLVDAQGCDPDLLRDQDAMRRLCARIIAELNLRVVGEPAWHQFPWPAGVTGLFLLTESHLACHTYPELGLATFNLYCCKSRPAWPWVERLSEILGASQVTVRCVVRGAAETAKVVLQERGES
jgi:S-adenosylmethionine decarboxylase